MALEMTVNGEPVSIAGIDPDERLLTVLRERLGRLEVKDGCSPQGQCGCCTVWLDGQPRLACVVGAEQAAGRSVTTAIGLPESVTTVLSGAFHACAVVQCAFCMPGIVMRMAALLRDCPAPSAEETARALRFHICRCVGGRVLAQAGARAGEILAGTRPLDPAPPYSPLLHPWEYPSDLPLAGEVWHLAPILAPGAGRLASRLTPPPGCELIELQADASHDGVILGLLAGPDRIAVRRAAAGLAVDWQPATAATEQPPQELFLAAAHPGFIEPESVIVDAETVTCSCERPNAIEGRRVRLVPDGGAFGGKYSPWLEQLAIAAADRLGGMVRISLTREESQRAGPTRHGARGQIELRDGRLQGTLVYVAGERSLYANEVIAAAHWCLPGPYQLDSEVTVSVEETSGPPSGWMRGEGSIAAVALRERALPRGLAARIDLLAPGSRIDACAREVRDWLDGVEPAGVALHVGRLPAVPAGVSARVEDGVVVHPYADIEPWRIGPQRGTGALGAYPTGGGWPFVLVSLAHGARPGGPGAAVAAAALANAAGQISEVRLVIHSGRIENPEIALSHVHGAAHMGLGAALSEQISRRGGITRSRSLRSLGILPVAATPPVRVRFIGSGPPLAGLADAVVAPVAAAAIAAVGGSHLPACADRR